MLLNSLRLPLTAINDAIDNLVMVTNVSSLTATGAKELTVNFNQAISEADQAKITFATKRGTTTTVVLTPAWAEDGKSATLTSGTNLVAGTYTVTASGIDFGVNSASAVVAARAAASIEITSDFVTIEDNTTIEYSVLDQYGDSMGAVTGATVTAFDKTAVSSVSGNTAGVLAVSTVAGKTQIKFTDIATKGFTFDQDQVLVTMTYGGVTTSKTLTARDVSAAATLDLVSANPLEGSEKIFAGDTGLTLSYTAVDQYGEPTILTTVAGDWVFTSSNTTVIDASTLAVDSDGVLTFNAGAKGTAVITAVNKTNGNSTSLPIEVFGVSAPTTIELTTPSVTIAQGEVVNVPFVVYDQYGEVIAAKSVDKSKITFTTTSGSIANLSWVGNAIKLTAGSTSGDVTLTATVKDASAVTTDTADISVTVQDAAVATTITGIKDVSTVLTEDSQTAIAAANLTVVDQYNRPYTLKNTDNVSIFYKTAPSGTPSLRPLLLASGVNEKTGTDFANGAQFTGTSSDVDITGTAKAGSAVMVAQLTDTNGDTFEFTMTNRDATGIVSYKIKPVNEMAVDGSNAANYQVVEVVGVDANGNDVALPAGTVTALTVNSGDFATEVSSMKVWSTTTTASTATLTAWVGAEAVATAELKSVVATPIATTAVFGEATYSIGGVLTSDAAKDDLTVKDQFGNVMAAPAGTWVSSDTDVATVGTTGTITPKSLGSTTITFIAASGVTATTTVEVTALTAVTDTDYTTVAGNTKLVITLTGGTFKAGTITAADFTFTGTDNAVIAAGTTFTRTSDTVVTITGITAMAGGVDNDVTVKAATMATQATSVAAVASTP